MVRFPLSRMRSSLYGHGLKGMPKMEPEIKEHGNKASITGMKIGIPHRRWGNTISTLFAWVRVHD